MTTPTTSSASAVEKILHKKNLGEWVAQLGAYVGDDSRQGTVIVLTGERGSGKSAVVEQLQERGSAFSDLSLIS